MSAPSSTASQTEFCDAMSKVHVYSEPPSGCDTPVPISKISADTLDTLNAETLCPLIKKVDRVKCNFTKKSYQTIDLPKHITCELSNIIYLISCTKCNKHYVGETCRAFRSRMYEHKSSVSKDGKKPTPVSRHFSSDGHSQKHMQFSVLEWCTP